MQTVISTQLSANLIASAESGTPSSKVRSRLLSSKALATEVTAVIEDLKLTLNTTTEGMAQVKDGVGDDHNTDKLPGRSKKAKIGVVKVAPMTDRVSSDNDKDGCANESENEIGLDISAADEVNNAADDGWESGSVLSGYGVTNDKNASPDDSESDDSDEEHVNYESQPIRKGSVQKARAPAAGSTFLPSLSVGFIPGSDSEWSDSEVRTTDVRKNRRGQRARRA